MKNLFNTEELIQLTGLKRHHLEYYRKENIIFPISDKPLRWDYKTVIFCLMIKEFKQKMNKNLALDCVKHFLEFHKNLDFIKDGSKIVIISELGRKFIIFIGKENNDNESEEIFKYFETPMFLDIDDSLSGNRMQLILDNRYVFYIELAKKHIEKLCIDLGYEDKIPSLS